MSRVILDNQPCPRKDCSSSDAYKVYDDGHGYCYSCGRPTFPEKDSMFKTDTEEVSTGNNNLTKQMLPEWRSLKEKTLTFYGTHFLVSPEGEPVRFVCTHANGAKRIRYLKEKAFSTDGAINEGGIFGWDRFNAGSAQAVTITEGYEDAMAVYQMMGSKYPSVSVRSSSTAKKDCQTAHEWLNSFEKIYLCFDNDTAGQKAKAEVASLFDFNKVYDVPLTKFKDANEYLEKGDTKSFVSSWYNAKRFLPQGVLTSFKEFDDALDEQEAVAMATFPFETLQLMTYGVRPELYLFTAQEGRGKTEVFRAIENHLLETTEDKIGIIHLEEKKSRTIKGIAGYKLGVPAHLPDSGVSNEDIKKAYREVIKTDERVHIYSRFGSDDPDVILDTIRFLVAVCGCKFVFLDHITLVVSGLEGDDERRKLDYISTRLAMMVEELNFALFLISHVNDDGKTRGSRNIAKVAHTHVHLDRDVENPDITVRNTTSLMLRKNRFAGLTGPAGSLLFDTEKYTLGEFIPEAPPF